MSNLYGTIDGAAKTRATRRGHRELTTHAAGWRGAIRVTVTHDANSGEDVYLVKLVPWMGSGGTEKILAAGSLDARG